MIKFAEYELVHIGMKINPNVDLDNLKFKLKLLMRDRGFEVFADPKPNDLLDIEIIARKGSADVEANYPTHALNIRGKEPEEVDSVHKELVDLLGGAGYDPAATVIFHDLIINMDFVCDKEPSSILSSAVRISLNSFKDSGNARISGLQIRDSDDLPLRKSGIIIEASPSNPKQRMRVRFQHQTPDPKDISRFAVDINKRGTDLLSSLGA